MKLSELAKEIGGARLVGGDAEISSLCTDSRVISKGDLFFCYRGTNTDSHGFAEDAQEGGAAAIVCERECGVACPQLIVKDGRAAVAAIAAAFYGHPERKMKMIGITGTNGKTTIAHMLYFILKKSNKAVGLIGTLGARYQGVRIPPALTTPDPVSLFSLLADMEEAGVKYVAMEVSAHALALGKTAPIRFALAIFTNLTQDHLDFFGTMEKYGAAKKLLFLPESAERAVLNADDPFFRTLEGVAKSSTTYGLDTPADCFAVIEQETARGSRFLLNLEDELVEAKISLAGRHNISNALAAATAARLLGIPPEGIFSGLAATRVEGRLERVASFRGADVFVDFAHTPDGLKKSLEALRPYCKGKLVLLFGCGGNRDHAKRPIMGKIAAMGADFTVVTSDNPRYEDPAVIIGEIVGGMEGADFVTIEERDRATEYALTLLGRGDILLIAGKGGESEQEIMGIKYPYNDKDVVETILEKMT